MRGTRGTTAVIVHDKVAISRAVVRYTCYKVLVRDNVGVTTATLGEFRAQSNDYLPTRRRTSAALGVGLESPNGVFISKTPRPGG